MDAVADPVAGDGTVDVADAVVGRVAAVAAGIAAGAVVAAGDGTKTQPRIYADQHRYEWKATARVVAFSSCKKESCEISRLKE